MSPGKHLPLEAHFSPVHAYKDLTMLIYFVTNKDTHARAVVIAPDERTACRLRPDNDFNNNVWWKHGVWVRVGTTPGDDKRAPALECWPVDLERIHADEIGKAGRMWSGSTQVLAFERDETPRRPGEGPDESWGALFAGAAQEDAQ